MSKLAWPMLSISHADNDIVKRIREYPGGVLRNVEARDILMVAASIALDLKLPEAPPQLETRGSDIMNGPTLGSDPLESYRQKMLVIYYSTAANGDLSVMNDTKAIVENFKDYAHRGLLYLSNTYLTRDGDDQLRSYFEEKLNRFKKILKNTAATCSPNSN